MLTYEELRSRLAINPNSLDGDCATHPVLFEEVGELASCCRAAAKAAKYNLERVQASVQLRYRNGTLASGDTKITEASVMALVATHEEVVKAKAELVDSELISSRCDSLLNAFDHRRSMLSNEVTLITQGFYHQGDIKGRRVLNEKTESDIAKVRGANERGEGGS